MRVRSKKKSFESQALNQNLLPDDFVIVCDEKGKALSTVNFAGQLEKVLDSGKKRVVFVIGGAYGLESNVLERANLKLSLSPFTVTHHLALAICFEQTYRAMTILRGVPYHNA